VYAVAVSEIMVKTPTIGPDATLGDRRVHGRAA
jgi:hypothetical protein